MCLQHGSLPIIGNYGNKLDTNAPPQASTTQPTNPVYDGNSFYFLPWMDTKPCVVVDSMWEDCTYRIEALNMLLFTLDRLVSYLHTSPPSHLTTFTPHHLHTSPPSHLTIPFTPHHLHTSPYFLCTPAYFGLWLSTNRKVLMMLCSYHITWESC